jgi:DNA replication and repair protein RecF
MSFIKKLMLTNYRVYKNNPFEFGDGINIIYGRNGIGKTNILEAISMLSPGKGILGADVGEILKVDEQNGWTVLANIGGDEIFDSLAVWTEEGKKKIKVNGNPVRSQEEMNKIFNVIWLAPSMQNFFNDEKSVRRKFLDRCVYLIDNQQASRVAKYEYLMHERLKVLQDNRNFDGNWLSVLEGKIADVGVEIAIARDKIVGLLNDETRQYLKEAIEFYQVKK